MRLRVLDVHADGCPHGGDECEHWDEELNPNETVTLTLHAWSSKDGQKIHTERCEVLTVERDPDDNVTIIVNGLDYQAKAIRFAEAQNEIETQEGIAASATVTAMRPKRSIVSTLLWLTGCFALVGVQAWASLNDSVSVFVLASAVLLIAVSMRT